MLTGQDLQDDHPPRAAFTLLELMVVLGILGVLVALTLPAIQRVRDAAARARCANNLRQVGLALHQYHNTHGRLPPGLSYLDGEDPMPFLSWTARLLPYLDQVSLWKQTEVAFAQERVFQRNPPHVVAATVLSLVLCPADSRTHYDPTRFGGENNYALTSYLGVEGTNLFRRDGLLFLDSRVRLGDIRDGTSHTLLVGERPASADRILGWWYAGHGQNHDGSADTVLGVRERNFHYEPRCPPGPYHFAPGRFDNQCDAFHFWSPHVGGGTHFLFADGSVRFLAYAADSVLPALATRAGGEPAVPLD